MKLKCLLCGDIIESKSLHDLVTCKCESCYIDGGNHYAHIGAKDFRKIVKILDDETEVHFEHKNGKVEYEIEIVETLKRVVKVQAENKEEALKYVKQEYKNEQIVLDVSDFINVEFKNI